MPCCVITNQDSIASGLMGLMGTDKLATIMRTRHGCIFIPKSFSILEENIGTTTWKPLNIEDVVWKIWPATAL